MPQPKNQMLRLLVPAIVIVVGIGVAYSVLKGTSKTTAPAPAPVTTPTTTTPTTAANQPAATQPPNPAPAPANAPAPEAPATGGPQASGQTPGAPAAPVSTGYHAVAVTPPGTLPVLGDVDPAGLYRGQVEFSAAGSGIKSLQLAKHWETILQEKHVEAQAEHAVPHTDVPADVLTPFAALAVEVTPVGGKPTIVPLAGTNVWQVAGDKTPHFEATIADDSGTPVLKLTRTFTMGPSTSQILLGQQVENLSKAPLTVRWFEAGPVDLPQDAIGYGGDKRRVRFGYLLPPEKDPGRSTVLSSEYLTPRATALGKREPVLDASGKQMTDAQGRPLVAFKDTALWPNDKSKSDRYDLVWLGMTNRYFGIAAYPVNTGSAGKVFAWLDQVSRIVLDGGQGNEVMALRLESKPYLLAGADSAGSKADFSHGIYAGPLDRSEMAKEPELGSLGLDGLVVFNFGGPCAFCTFAPMANLLLWILHTLHDKVFQDWSLSIIFLVLIVRTCLHPVTKWSQIRMARFGKQMSGIAPKQKILQEKYKDDPKKLQEETGKLWREEGISPAGFLGCLPMVLQMPVWIALYASLYFSVEMRNYPAFYGVFQAIQPKASPLWQFLGNLAEPDRLLYFGGKTVATLPLLGPIMSLNILPILLAVVFFIQQKYLTPPTTATMTPEQEFQQKIMRWMTVFMFPVFMYNAPSGLAIYFICNSTFAILESKYIRSHMNKYDMLNVDKMRAQRQAKQGRSGGIMSRLQEMAEAKQTEARKRAGLPPGRKK